MVLDNLTKQSKTYNEETSYSPSKGIFIWRTVSGKIMSFIILYK
jgi:hypothetical protein